MSLVTAGELIEVEELGALPPPEPARPRLLLIGTILGSVATLMLFASLMGVYLQARATTLAGGENAEWGLDNIPLTPGNFSLFGFLISMFTIQWAVDAIGKDDRRHAWIAFGCTIFVAAMHAVGMAFLYSQVGADVTTVSGGLFYAVTGAHLALVLLAVLFVVVMAFRTLGGQYSAKDREGVVAAAIFWHSTAIIYFGIWYGILVVK